MSIEPKFIIGRPKDAPSWAKYAAIDEFNIKTYFEQKPYPDKKNPGKWRSNAAYHVVGNEQPPFFDQWQDTLALISSEMNEGDERAVIPGDIKKPTYKPTAAAKKKMGVIGRSPSMPVWVNFRAIDDDGAVVYYETKPYRNSRAPGEWRGNTRSFPGGLTDIEELKGTVHRIVSEKNPIPAPEKRSVEPEIVPSEPRFAFESETPDDDVKPVSVGLLTSNARPEYARAASLVENAPVGAVIVFSYRPQWFTPDAILVPGEEVVVFKTSDGQSGLVCPIRTVRILDIRFEDGKLFIPIIITESDNHKRIAGLLPAPDNGKAVFTY